MQNLFKKAIINVPTYLHFFPTKLSRSDKDKIVEDLLPTQNQTNLSRTNNKFSE